jgi:exopolysaccharide biosynthesis polyprenyl glycosylphosphotransferase
MAESRQALQRSSWSFPFTNSQPVATTVRASSSKGRFWIVADATTVFGAAALATTYKFQTGPLAELRGFWHGTLIPGRSMGILLALVFVFAATLIGTSRRLHLYTPLRLSSFLHEQRLSIQACLTSGLFLTGTLYLVRAEDISRSIVLITIGLVTVALSLRRLLYRILIYRRFERGVGTRNAIIVGTGPEALALRHHLEHIGHLGYTFKGFIEPPGAPATIAVSNSEVLGSFATLFQNARKQFADEIFFTTSCEPGAMRDVLQQARQQGIDLRVVPDLYDGLAWNSPIEYVGQFPTIPLHSGHVPEFALLMKRGLDLIISSVTLLALSPLLLVLAVAVKCDSTGPVFYLSERIGKKGRVFQCFKFRTMVRDAEKRRADFMHLNERDGILFKIANDPRITRLGRVLRKYSLDELPQLFNVLRGDMSIVGPRPPLASEVRDYKLSHLRRLDVTPGITGLWQVQARQDPSFDNYISLDVTYVDNWSIWLDLQILVRTVAVVCAGTGS